MKEETKEKKEKAMINVGLFAGIINPAENGKLLLRRRIEEHSITGESYRGCWELPGGGVLESDEKVSYDYCVKELAREVREEIGMEITVSPMPAVYPVLFKTPNRWRVIPYDKEGKLEEGKTRDINLYDLAVVTVIESTDEPHPKKSETKYVSPSELQKLAEEYAPANKEEGIDGRGLLSGVGKRMHCMALMALSQSSNSEYAEEAKRTLREIQKNW